MQGKSVSQWLNGSLETQSIARHAQRLLDLQQALLEFVPHSLAQASTVCALREGTLVVIVDNGAIAQKFRLISPQLLKQIRKDFQEVNQIHCVVQGVDRETKNKRPEKHALVTESGLKQLDTLAAALPDSDLKTAVMRMAARHRRGAKEKE